MAVTDESRGLDETVYVAREDGRACRCANRQKQLPHSHGGPEIYQPKWCRPSGAGPTCLDYLTRTENLRLGDGCDVVLAEMLMMHA